MIYPLMVCLFYLSLPSVSGPYSNPEFDSKIRRLTDMGIESHDARVALSSFNWDLERATEQLFS